MAIKVGLAQRFEQLEKFENAQKSIQSLRKEQYATGSRVSNVEIRISALRNQNNAAGPKVEKLQKEIEILHYMPDDVIRRSKRKKHELNKHEGQSQIEQDGCFYRQVQI